MSPAILLFSVDFEPQMGMTRLNSGESSFGRKAMVWRSNWIAKWGQVLAF